MYRNIRLLSRPSPQCPPPARKRAPSRHAKGAAAWAVLCRRHRCPKIVLPREHSVLQPCRQPLSGLFILGGAARIALALHRLEYRRLRQPPMLRGWMFQRYAFFLCPSAEKRDRCLVLNITGIVCRAETAIPSEMTIIFNTAISYVSAPSSRQSCRREHSSLHPCQGWKRLFPPLAGCVLLCIYGVLRRLPSGQALGRAR